MQLHTIVLAFFTLICYIIGDVMQAHDAHISNWRLDIMATKIKQQLILQFDGQEADLSAIEAIVKKDWKDAGKKLSDIESLDIYVKPQEGKAYYVVNKEVEGKVDLF